MIFEITTIDTEIGDYIRIAAVVPKSDGSYSDVVGENSTSFVIYGRLVWGDCDQTYVGAMTHRNQNFFYRYIPSNMSGGTWKNLEDAAFITHKYVDDAPKHYRHCEAMEVNVKKYTVDNGCLSVV